VPDLVDGDRTDIKRVIIRYRSVPRSGIAIHWLIGKARRDVGGVGNDDEQLAGLARRRLGRADDFDDLESQARRRHRLPHAECRSDMPKDPNPV
jgi:hypothetical protein